MLAAAALAGAAGGLILGRFIDAGHIRRAVWINAACLVATVILKAGCGDDPILVLMAATISAVLLQPGFETSGWAYSGRQL